MKRFLEKFSVLGNVPKLWFAESALTKLSHVLCHLSNFIIIFFKLDSE